MANGDLIHPIHISLMLLEQQQQMQQQQAHYYPYASPSDYDHHHQYDDCVSGSPPSHNRKNVNHFCRVMSAQQRSWNPLFILKVFLKLLLFSDSTFHRTSNHALLFHCIIYTHFYTCPYCIFFYFRHGACTNCTLITTFHQKLNLRIINLLRSPRIVLCNNQNIPSFWKRIKLARVANTLKNCLSKISNVGGTFTVSNRGIKKSGAKAHATVLQHLADSLLQCFCSGHFS